MKNLIVGLGNSKTKYRNTRHNAGFIVADRFISLLPLPAAKLDKKNECHITQDSDYIVMKPTTLMNNSGRAVQKVINYFSLTDASRIYVLHDDLDLAFGSIKIQKNKNSAGHNGVISIMDYLQTKDFWRLRIGIRGPTKTRINGSRYVLSRFTKEEQERLNGDTDQAIAAQAAAALRDHCASANKQNISIHATI